MSSEQINECIREAFTTFGYEVKIGKEDFMFEPLSLKISGEMDNADRNDQNIHSARLIIHLEHKKFPQPINEFVYGWGDSAKNAIINAFERWIESDFPVVHDMLADHKISETSTVQMKLVSHSGITDEQISWKGVIGSLLSSDNPEIMVEENIRYEIFRILFDDISGDFLGEKGVYPIKCFLSKDEKGNINVDCRLNGKIWERGWHTLHNYCQNWNVSKYSYWKQYFIIHNVDNLPDEDLVKELEKERRRLNEE